MSDNQLSRRKVLGALATTGGAGAIVGTGTGALFTDEETFTSNGIEASTSVAGTVDIEVDYDVISDGTSVIYDITLPEDVNNNPSYVWFRTGCPDPLELGCATEIEIREECDGTTDTIATGSARDALNALRDGTLLCIGGDTCLQPGETQTLEIEVDGVDNGYDGPDGPLEFDIEFYGEQCRYNTGAENPFGDYEKCDSCGVSIGGGSSESTGKGISFIEIYTNEGGSCEVRGKIELEDGYCGNQSGISENVIEPGTYDLFEDDDCNDTGYDVEVTDTETKDGGAETVAVAFEVFDSNDDPIDLCRVDIKAGSGQTTYDDSGDFDGNATDGLLDAGGQS